MREHAVYHSRGAGKRELSRLASESTDVSRESYLHGPEHAESMTICSMV